MSMYWLYLNDQTQPQVPQQPLNSSLVGHPIVDGKLFYAVTNDKLTLQPNDAKIAWTYLPSLYSTRPDTSKHFHIFVGDLCPKLHPSQLYEAFSPFGQISECKIIQDPQTMNSKGYGFVTFIKKDDAENAIKWMNGRQLGSRTIRTNWAVRKKSLLESGCGKMLTFEDVYRQTSANNSTVYCGGVMTGLTEELLTKTFSEFGQIVDIRIFKDKGYAFIRFETKEAATRAIIERHLSELNGHIVKCSWGKKTDEAPMALLGSTNQLQIPSSPSPSLYSQLLAPALLPTGGLLAPSAAAQTAYTNLILPSTDLTNQLRYYLWPEGSTKTPDATVLPQQSYSLPIQLPGLTALQQPATTLPGQQHPGFLYSLGL